MTAGTTDLSTLTDEEYGGGTELPTTGFLVLGLLSFWIYTVWEYHRLLRRHVASRLRHFSQQRDPATLSAESRRAYERLIAHGFRPPVTSRNIALSLYGLSLALILSELAAEVLFLNGALREELFYSWVYTVVGGAALLFCTASIYFMSWAGRATRDHEYHELLLARLVRDPEGFRMVRPSDKFAKRWNRIQSLLALFLVLSVPMTISPVFAVIEVRAASEVGTSFTASMVGWLAALFVFAAIFHLWGTHLLLGMYNGHLRIEELNQQVLTEASRWLPERTPAVLDERPDSTTDQGPGDLLPRRVLAAIMITDMVGFSRDMEHSEERTYSKLMRHNDLVREKLAKHHGTEVKTIGDAFLVQFRSPVEAVQAAVEIQRALAEHNAKRETDERIVVRIGIHTGDVLTMDGDVLGNNVNLAARIEPLAEPGGICISEETYALVRSRIRLEVASIGRRPLKNIENPPELFKIVLGTLPEGASASGP